MVNNKNKKNISKHKKLILLGILALILIFVDQITKQILPNLNFDIGFFALSNITNTGVSFGMLKGSSPIIILISLVFLGLIIYYKDEFKDKEIYAILIISGIIGNLIDRIFLRHVIDFIDFKWFPVFNFADTWIFIGVFGFIIHKLIEEYKLNKNKKSKKIKS